MTDYPVTITAQEVRVGDVIRREYDPVQKQRPWSGIVVDVERAERPNGTELRKLVVRGERWNDDHFMELTAPIVRTRSGFTEFLPEHIPFSLNTVRCGLCQALVESGYERGHIAWHVSILNLIHSASTAHMDLSGGR